MYLFGYIKPKIPELKVGDYDRYKGIYCSLCKHMGKEYGKISRFALSYDGTFLALLLLSLQEDCTPFQSGKCVFNPAKRCNFCTSGEEQFYFAAALTVLMTHQKLRDDLADSGFLGKLRAGLALLFAAGARKKAVKKYPQLQHILQETIATQLQVEQQESPCIDACAEPTAQMLGRTFALLQPQDEALTRVLQNFGYFLGKWVYLMDAADDLEKDLQRGEFNPFVLRFALTKQSTPQVLQQAREHCNASLNAVASQVVAAYHLLPLNHFVPILDNIILEGLPQMQKELLFKKESKHVGSI